MESAVRLPLSFDPEPLRVEVDSLVEAEWVPHFNTSYYTGEWSGVALRAIGGAPLQLYPDPAATGAFEDTDTLRRCPRLAEAVAAFACPLQSVRLLRLGAGAAVREHRDYRLGYDDGEVRIHVPITTSSGAEFLLEGRPIEMRPGEAWYVDFNLPHSVANRGGTPRVHLVLDCDVNDWLRGQLEAGDPA